MWDCLSSLHVRFLICNFKWDLGWIHLFLCILDLFLFYLLSELREKHYLQVRMSSIDCDEFDTDFINSASNVVKDNWKNQDNCNASTKMILRSRTNDPKPKQSDDPTQIDLDCTMTPSTPHARRPDATVPLPTDTTPSSSSRVSTLIWFLPMPPRHSLFYFAIYRQSRLLIGLEHCEPPFVCILFDFPCCQQKRWHNCNIFWDWHVRWIWGWNRNPKDRKNGVRKYDPNQRFSDHGF